nr:MAG: ORF1a [Istigobius nigroocellatus astrovirus]
MDFSNINNILFEEDIFNKREVCTVQFTQIKRVNIPLCRHSERGVVRTSGEYIVPNRYPTNPKLRGWDCKNRREVFLTDAELELIIGGCKRKSCTTLKSQVTALKREVASLQLKLLTQTNVQQPIKPSRASQTTMEKLRIIILIIAGLWILSGVVPVRGFTIPGTYSYRYVEPTFREQVGSMAKDVYNTVKETATSTVTDSVSWARGVGQWAIDGISSLHRPRFQWVVNLDETMRLRAYTAAILNTMEGVLSPIREYLASLFDATWGMEWVTIVVLVVMSRNGLYVFQNGVQIYNLASAMPFGFYTIAYETGHFFVTLCGGYSFAVRAAEKMVMCPYSIYVLLLAATGIPQLVYMGIALQMVISMIVIFGKDYKSLVVTDDQGNEKVMVLSMWALAVAIAKDQAFIYGSVAVLQVPLGVLGLGVICYGFYKGCSEVEIEPFEYKTDGTKVTVCRRKVRKMLSPWVKAQSKRAVGAVVNEKVYEAAFPVRGLNGELGQGFLYCGKLCVLKHVTQLRPFSVNCAGKWVEVKTKLQNEMPMSGGQTLLCYALPEEMSGVKHCKSIDTRENGWMMIGYVSPESYNREVQCFYGTWNESACQFTGVYEHMPGMSGAPVFNKSGRLVGVHYGAAGLVGVIAPIEPIPTTPRKKNPNSEAITKLSEAYQAEPDGTERKAVLKRLLGHQGRGACPEEDKEAMKGFGEWTFLQAKNSGYLDDHKDVATQEWVVKQLVLLWDKVEALLHAPREQKKKSLAKSKGNRKRLARFLKSGGIMTRASLHAFKLPTGIVGKQFTEQEYEELQKSHSADAIRTFAVKRYLQKYEDADDSDEYESDGYESDESMTYKEKTFDVRDQFLCSVSKEHLQELANRIEKVEKENAELKERQRVQKEKFAKTIRKLSDKVKNKLPDVSEQLLKIESEDWEWDDGKPTVKKEVHIVDMPLDEAMAVHGILLSPFSSVTLTEEDKCVTINGAKMDMPQCEGCCECKPETKEQASKKQPVKAACGALTTCYSGHLRYCAKGCKPETPTSPIEPCEKSCVHYWCAKTKYDAGKPCTRTQKCNNAFCIEKQVHVKKQVKAPKNS